MNEVLIVLEIAGFDQLQRERPYQLDADWTDFFARLDGSCRLVSVPAPYDLGATLRQIDGQLAPLEARERALRPLAAAFDTWDDLATPDLATLVAALPEALRAEADALLAREIGTPRARWGQVLDRLAQPLWRIGPLRSYRQEVRRQQELGLRGLRHFLLAWLPAGSRAAPLIQAIQDTFDTAAWEADLPSILAGPYQHQFDHLAPLDPGHPAVALLTAYERQGAWDNSVFHRVLQLPLPVALCVDVEEVDPRLATWLVDQADVSKRQALSERQGPRDVRAEEQYASAQRMQEALTTQQLHALRFVFAVFGPTPEALDDGVRQVQDALGSRMRLMRPPGAQRALEQFFRPVPTRLINAPARRRYEPSRGAAVSVPFGVRKPTRAEGVEVVNVDGAPLTLDLFGERRAAHGLIAGVTGIGKTFAINCWLRRLAVLHGIQVVLYEPQGHGRHLAASCGAGARHLLLSTHHHANVLDVVISQSRAGEPPAVLRQIEHVITQLSVLLASNTAGGATIVPRAWSGLERGVLALALQQLYAPWAADLGQLAPEDTPILADLCAVLHDLAIHEVDVEVRERALALAGEIHLRLVRGPHGAMFNATTNIDWAFEGADVLAFDFSELEAGYLQTFYYSAAFGALYRHIHNPHRRPMRPILAAIDEFRIMAQVPGLREFVASLMKHGRAFGGHVWVIDQDFHVLDGPDEASQSIITNSTFRAIFHQETRNAERVGETLDGIRPHHVRAITKPVRGQCVVSWKGSGAAARENQVVVGRVEPTAEEFAFFRRT
jgi:hypothetical protein